MEMELYSQFQTSLSQLTAKLFCKTLENMNQKKEKNPSLSAKSLKDQILISYNNLNANILQ